MITPTAQTHFTISRESLNTFYSTNQKPAAERYNELSGGKLHAALAALAEAQTASAEAASPDDGDGGGDDGGGVNIHIASALAPLARESVDGDGTRHCQLIHPSMLLPNKAITTFAEAKEQEELVMLSVRSEGELVNAVEGACSAAVGWT